MHYSGTLPYGHLVITATIFVLAKCLYIFLGEIPLNAITPLILPSATF